jgi:hypothetical protein
MRKHTRAALAAAPLSLALLLAACGSDDDDSADTTTTTTTTEATTSSSSEPSETSAPGSSEVDTPPPSDPAATEPASQAGDPLPTQGDAWASELVRAWGAGDRDRAAELATPEALDQLFGYEDPGGDDWELQSCDSTAMALLCTFTSASRSASLVTEERGSDGVASVRFGTADPEGVTAEQAGAADDLIQAWGAGDRAAAEQLAVASDVDALFRVADPGGTTWEQAQCVAIDDDPQCTYRSPDHADTVIVHLSREGTGGTPVSYVFAFEPSA